MDLQVDLRVAELLASRLCHDLVGPIGAVNNGMELLTDDEFGMADDALKLASKSAAQTADLLQFYRLAYGMAGSHQGPDLGPMRELAAGFLAHSKSSLEWPPGTLPDGMPEEVGKLVLNIIALANEALPRGGTIAVNLSGGAEGGKVEVKAVGADAGLRPEAMAALEDDVQVRDLTPRNVHGYFTRLVARRLGGDLAVEAVSPGFLRFSSTVKG